MRNGKFRGRWGKGGESELKGVTVKEPGRVHAFLLQPSPCDTAELLPQSVSSLPIKEQPTFSTTHPRAQQMEVPPLLPLAQRHLIYWSLVASGPCDWLFFPLRSFMYAENVKAFLNRSLSTPLNHDIQIVLCPTVSIALLPTSSASQVQQW